MWLFVVDIRLLEFLLDRAKCGGITQLPHAALVESVGYSLWLLCVVPVCGRTKKGVRDTIIFNIFILVMSPIASAPFFTFNFSRFQDAFLCVYLYFILET